MTKKFLPFASVLIVLLISACGSSATPTISAADMANTAVAQAWIAITETQAAMPTNTPTLTPPPTDTPQPTFTPYPTIDFTVPTIAPAATLDPCNQPPPIKPQGQVVQVKFVNKSGGQVNLAFGMQSPNAFNECVTYTFALGAFDQPVVTVLAGCYWAYGWVTGKNPSSARNIDQLCVTDPTKVPAIWISTEVVSFH